MNNSLFTDLDQTLERGSPQEAIDRLCIMLKNKGDYHSLFECLMLQTRLKLGLPAMLSPTGDELTPEQKADYEKAVREAAKTIGQHFLDDKNLLNAWPYFRMIGETEPMAQVLETWEPGEADDEAFPAILDMAIQQGAAPVRGVQLLLKRYGLCNAITMMGQNFPHGGAIRQQAVGILVNALYTDLRNSLAVHAKELTGDVPDDNSTIGQIVEANAKLTEDDCYHIDVSHPSSVVQYALELPPGEVTKKVIGLCIYGSKLAQRFQPNSEPPFEEGYRDYLHYYRALNGIDAEAGLNHFRLKAESVEQGTEMTAPAEVYVHLLAQLGRHGETLHAFARYLTQANPRQLACPLPTELARQSGEYAALAELCLRRGDAVGYAVAKAAGASKA